MLNCLFVGIGGFLGSIARYLFGLIPIKESHTFPINTLIINILGAFIIGIIVALVGKNVISNEKLILLLKVGFCGGFTTFSSFSQETYSLFEKGLWHIALLYIVLSVFLCVLSVFIAQNIIK